MWISSFNLPHKHGTGAPRAPSRYRRENGNAVCWSNPPQVSRWKPSCWSWDARPAPDSTLLHCSVLLLWCFRKANLELVCKTKGRGEIMEIGRLGTDMVQTRSNKDQKYAVAVRQRKERDTRGKDPIGCVVTACLWGSQEYWNSFFRWRKCWHANNSIWWTPLGEDKCSHLSKVHNSVHCLWAAWVFLSPDLSAIIFQMLLPSPVS